MLINRSSSPDTSNWNLSHAYNTSWLMSNANSTWQQYSATFSAFSRSRIERIPVKVVQMYHSYRPSDRVRGCGTAQFGQTRTITHNSQNPAKSRTILKDLLKHLIKSGLLLITKIPKNFLGYFQAIYLPKQSRNPSLSRSLERI